MYHPGADLAYDEISILMTGLSLLKKQLHFKPVSDSIQFLALAESNNGSQYLYWVELDSNDKEQGKTQCTLLRCIGNLPPNSRNQRIAADNLSGFNSMESCRAVERLGHRIYGTMHMNNWVPTQFKDHLLQMTAKGDRAIIMAMGEDISICLA